MKYNTNLKPFGYIYLYTGDGYFSTNPMASISLEEMESWVNTDTVRVPTKEEFATMDEFKDLTPIEQFIKWTKTDWNDYPEEFITRRNKPT